MSDDIAFDAQIFRMQERGGISRYFVELMRQFGSDPDLGVTVRTPFRAVRNQHLLESYPDRFESAPPVSRMRARFARNAGAERIAGVEAVHHTFYDPTYLRCAGELPAISTVHDMIPELYPEDFRNGSPHLAKESFVRASNGILCVSETTKRDMFARYGSLDAEIAVVPLGVGEEFHNPRPTSASLPEVFVLFVGHRGGYKGFDVLVRALAPRPELAALHVVCIGGGAFSVAEDELVASSGLADRVHAHAVADIDLPGVYARARCFVYPSRYEGFGLPLLEASAAGCPVIAADTPVFHEVAGDTARFFDPTDPAALADELGRLLLDESERAALVERGRRRAAEFTWRRTAELTATFYRAVTA